MFTFPPPRQRRKPSLTPMIDVVFLLLVFFMLSSQFGRDNALPLSAALAGDAAYTGPPRLVDINADGLRLNGVPLTVAALIEQLPALMQSRADLVILRGDSDTSVQRLIDVAETLQDAGFTQLTVVE